MTAATGRPPGRRPQPVELTRLKGNPGKRALRDAPVAAKPSRVPPVPASLGPVGRAKWEHYWATGRAWTATADASWIERLCKLHDYAAKIEAAIANEGFLNVSDKTERSFVHAAFNNLLGIYNRIDTMESLQGFEASSRTRLRADPEDNGDALDQWQAGKTG